MALPKYMTYSVLIQGVSSKNHKSAPFSHIKCQELSLKPSLIFKQIWGTFGLSLQTVFILPLKRLKWTSALGSWLGAILYCRKRDCFNAQRNTFQTSRAPLPQKPGVKTDLSYTESHSVWGDAERFREVLLAPDLSFLHPFCLETKTTGCFLLCGLEFSTCGYRELNHI